MLRVVTWGEVVDMSYEFLHAYNDQSLVALNDLEISTATGQSPEAFDFATLVDDLDQLGDPVTPPDYPPP